MQFLNGIYDQYELKYRDFEILTDLAQIRTSVAPDFKMKMTSRKDLQNDPVWLSEHSVSTWVVEIFVILISRSDT